MDRHIVNTDRLNGIHGNNTLTSNAHPLVSIIVATYGRDISLERALLSLLNQTYDFIEIIVVDDNADEVWNRKIKVIISDIMSKNNREITCIHNSTNKGSAETRNIGIRASSGAYVTFLDDDDIYLPRKVENQLKYMLRNNSDYCVTDLNLYDESDRLIEKRSRKYIKQNNQSSLLMYHLMYHITGTDTMMFKRDYLVGIGGFPQIDVGDEFYLMQKSIEAGGRFSYLPECDVKAYVHTTTLGLSSGDSKIEGENALYKHKKVYFNQLSYKNKKYIIMRHYAVLAFAEIRRKNYGKFLNYAVRSFLVSPINCFRLLLQYN